MFYDDFFHNKFDVIVSLTHTFVRSLYLSFNIVDYCLLSKLFHPNVKLDEEWSNWFSYPKQSFKLSFIKSYFVQNYVS